MSEIDVFEVGDTSYLGIFFLLAARFCVVPCFCGLSYCCIFSSFVVGWLFLYFQSSPHAPVPSVHESPSDRRDIVTLLDACHFLDKAELYEQCNATYQQLITYYAAHKQWPQLTASYEHLHEITAKLVVAERDQSRMLGTYYRVGFYGRKFGPKIDGREFVYKMPRITRLMEITSNLKTLYSNQFGLPVKVCRVCWSVCRFVWFFCVF